MPDLDSSKSGYKDHACATFTVCLIFYATNPRVE